MKLEALIGFLPPVGYLCWWLAGRGIWPGKAWRRDLWPLLLVGVGLWQGRGVLTCVGAAVGLDIAHRLPYGADKPFWKTLVAALAMGIAIWCFGTPWYWGVAVSGIFVAGSELSWHMNAVSWAWVESLTGFVQGMAMVYAFRS